MRKVITISLYVVSCMFFYTAGLCSFVNQPPPGAKFTLLGVFIGLAGAALALGLWVSGFAKVKRDVGIVLLSASAVIAFVAFSCMCMILSPETSKLFPENKLAFFSDYTTGISVLLLLAVSGGVLTWSARRPPADKTRLGTTAGDSARATAEK